MNGSEPTVSLPVFVLCLAGMTMIRAACARRNHPAVRGVSTILEIVLIASTLLFLILQPFVGQSYQILSASMHPTLWENDRVWVNKWVYRVQSPAFGEIVVVRPPAARETEPPYIKRIIGTPGDIIAILPGFVEIGERSDDPFAPHPVRFGAEEIRALLGDTASVSETARARPPLRLFPDHIEWGTQIFSSADLAARAGHSGEPVRIRPSILIRNGRVVPEPYLREEVEYRVSWLRVPAAQLFVLGDNRNVSQDSHIWGVLPEENIIGRAGFVFYPRMKQLRNGE